MKVHALTTGTVRLTDAFLYPRPGIRRQLSLFVPGPLSEPMPIHAWVIEHGGRRILVDTGETAAVRNIPFARFDVSGGDELPAALASIGLSIADLDTAVLTHMHGDHMDGAVHLGGMPVLVQGREIEHAHAAMTRLMARILRQPIPAGVRFQPYELDDGPFGAFEASKDLSGDGRVVAVATPGHTPGHVSVICIDDDGRHLMIAGDTTDSLEQLRARRADAVSPDPTITVATIDRILSHARANPVVYLPAHDPESVSRLAAGTTL